MSKVITKSYTSCEKRNLKLLSFGCHKISTMLSRPYGNRAAGRSNRVILTEVEEISVVINPWREMPLSPSCDSDISRSCLVIQYFSLHYALSLHPQFLLDRNDQYTTYPRCRLSRIKVSHDSSMEDTTRI